MEDLRSTYKDDNDEEQQSRDPLNQIPAPPPPDPNNLMPPPPELASLPTLHPATTPQNPTPSSSAAGSGDDEGYDSKENGDDPTPVPPQTIETLETPIPSDDDGGLPYQPRKKQNHLSIFPSVPPPPVSAAAAAASKKPIKKKGNNLWTKSTSRKGKKKGKNSASTATAPTEDAVLITPVPRLPDKSDDAPDAQICLSRIHKAEKVELSDDRLAAGSTKGYRMVRATRGVVEGSWYFEIRIVRLGPTGHTRLGWTTEKGDLQAPVGYDGNSYGFRDIDGCKIHKAMRDKYGDEGYLEGDVIGFYISLPDGELYAPKPPQLVWYKGQKYIYSADVKDEPPKVVPGSEISFFKNGVCLGVAFANLFGGRYYPAASMYTLPNQPNCEVRFNFGPDFEFFPQEIGGRPTPRPMIESPYHGYDSRADAPTENGCNNS